MLAHITTACAFFGMWMNDRGETKKSVEKLYHQHNEKISHENKKEKRKRLIWHLIERNVSESVDFFVVIQITGKKEKGVRWKRMFEKKGKSLLHQISVCRCRHNYISRVFIDFPRYHQTINYYHQMPSLISGDVDKYSLSLSSSILMLNLPSLSSSSSVCRLLIFLFFFLIEHFSFNLAVVINLIDSAEALRIGAFAVMKILLVSKKSDTDDDDAVDFNLINCSRGVIAWCCSCTDMTFFNASISFHTWHLIWPNSQPICFDSDACVFC